MRQKDLAGYGAMADQGNLGPLPEYLRLIDPECGVFVKVRLTAFCQPDIYRLVGRQGILGGEFRLDGIDGGYHGQVRHGPGDADVLDGVVGHPHGGVGDAAADPRQDNGKLLVADVVADLLVTAVEQKRDDVVDEHLVPGQGQTGGKADGVLLGHPHVEESVRMLLLEPVEDP